MACRQYKFYVFGGLLVSKLGLGVIAMWHVGLSTHVGFLNWYLTLLLCGIRAVSVLSALDGIVL